MVGFLCGIGCVEWWTDMRMRHYLWYPHEINSIMNRGTSDTFNANVESQELTRQWLFDNANMEQQVTVTYNISKNTSHVSDDED